MSASWHFRPLGLGLSTPRSPSWAKPPPPCLGPACSRGHCCRPQRGCQSKPAPVTCRKAAGGRGLGWAGDKEGTEAGAGAGADEGSGHRAGTGTALFRSWAGGTGNGRGNVAWAGQGVLKGAGMDRAGVRAELGWGSGWAGGRRGGWGQGGLGAAGAPVWFPLIRVPIL